MDGKKKKTIFGIALVGIAILLCSFAACGEKHIEPNMPIQDLLIEYPLDNVLAYAPTEDGTVYVINLEQLKDGGQEYRLHCFGGQGTHEMDVGLKDYTMIEAIAVSEDGSQVYFTAQNNEYGIGLYLFSYSVEGDVVTLLCGIPYFSSIRQLAVTGDMIYLLGKSPDWQPENAPTVGYSFAGERLVAYLLATGEQIQLGFDFPVSMSASGVGTLIVFGYLAGDGYCMMEYDPQKDSMQMLSRVEEYKFNCFAACNGGKEVVYDYSVNSRGLVISDIRNLAVEAELYPDSFTLRLPPACAGGSVYCYSLETGSLISFSLEAVQRKNGELTFLSKAYGTLNAPYGCGYAMNRVELSDEKFTLKILARDKDYDLCMGDTLLGSGWNLRENGVFYPLNDVPGIEEYLERCFPYVREAATKEDGTIWMLPIDVNIYGLAVRQKAAQQAGLNLYGGMTWAGYAQAVLETAENERERIGISASLLLFLFGNQYFPRYHTLEGGLFADTYTALSGLWEAGILRDAAKEDSIVVSVGASLWIASGRDSLKRQYGEDVTFIEVPKLSPSDGNIANCVFLAVNPDSAKRDEALAYLADLAVYLSQREDLPFFADWQGEDAVIHEVYKNGEIVFAVDSDIYKEGFEELFSGELSLEEYVQKTEQKLRIYWGE